MKNQAINTHNSLSALNAEKIKILFQFSLMLCISFVGGIMFSNLFSEHLYNNALHKITAHFNYSYSILSNDLNIVFSYLKFCIWDILCVFIIFAFSFSFVNYVISDLILVANGFKLGISLSVIWKLTFVRIGFINCLLYVAYNLVLLPLLLIYTYKMAVNSISLKKVSNVGRIIVNRSVFIKMMISSLSFLGLVFIIDGIYFLLIYIL